MRFADVIGHERAVARLGRMADEGRVPGAVLLLGPRGIGKRTLADAFAMRLLCEAPSAGDACGVCRHCTRVAAGAHPELRTVTREEERRDIRIEQVRELTRWLYLQPLMAERKIGIVDDAQCLNEHGQNALLKTLEEPPGSSVLVLVSSSAALLLPTVRSRCTIVRLEPLLADAVARVLAAHVPDAEVDTLAPLAEGSPGRALELASKEAAQGRGALLKALPGLGDLAADEISRIAQELSRGAADVALAAALGWYRDVLEAALVGDALPRRNPRAAAEIRAAAARLPPEALLRQLRVVCDTIGDLEKNANRMLSVETMMLWLREIEREARSA
jgi:DNA polymerase III subunit delta'